jgi:hypothetical protein
VQSPVREAVGTVQGAVPAAPGAPAPSPAPAPPPAPPAAGPQPQTAAPVEQAPAQQQQQAVAPAGQTSAPLFSDARTVRARSTGSGTAVLDAFSAAIGMGSVGGFGSASGLQFDAMAPEIASPFATVPASRRPSSPPRRRSRWPPASVTPRRCPPPCPA